MIKQLAALALTGSVILGCASSAVAGDQLPFDETKLNNLLTVVRETGHSVYSGGGLCDAQPAYGFATTKKQLIICVDHHKGNKLELADTIRHEAVHLAQFCKGRRVGASAALIFPDRKDTLRGVEALEAEARTMAREMDADQIAVILRGECRYD